MKKLIILLLSLCGLAPAQAQLEWAPVGAKYYYSTWWGFSGETGVTVVEVVGDTVVQGKNCRYFQQVSGTVPWHFWCEGHHITYSEDGRVYFFNDEAQEFDLFYDFNKMPGESWDVILCGFAFCEADDTLRIQVAAVTDTLLNNVSVRKMNLTSQLLSYPTYTFQWTVYEGIGSFPIMHYFWERCITVEAGIINLRCYESPTHGIFNFVGGQPCDIYTAAGEARPEMEKLLLHPNPAWESLHIQFPRMGAWQLALYDARGRLFKTQSFDNVPETWVLDVSALPAGIYLLQYRSEGRVMAVERFVKQ